MGTIMEYAEYLNASKEVKDWLTATGKKALSESKVSESDMEHILDYLVSSAAPKRLQKMSIADAKRKTAAWTKANQKKGRNIVDSDEDIELVHDFFDGNKIVRLKTKTAYQREGFMMGHCVGSYNPNSASQVIYSYRDNKNQPHATFEVSKEQDKIMQIKGKGNGTIHPKYIYPILEFLISLKIDIRPDDMKYLGYYEVPQEHLPYIKSIGLGDQLVTIRNVLYAK